MKSLKNIFILFVLLMNFASYSQIFPGDGLVPVVSCNFETDCNVIHLDTNISGNAWRIGEPTNLPFDAAYSLPNAIVTNLTNDYPQGNDSWFDIIINVWNMGLINPVLTFWHKYETDTLTDGGFVEISYDKGNSWKNVVLDTSCLVYSYDYGTPNRESFYSAADTIKGGIPAFSGTSDGWQFSRIQWIWFVPVKELNETPIDTMIFRFHFKSDSIETNKAGWMIDDIVLYNTLLSDIPEWQAEERTVKIFPNPATDEIKFSLQDIGTVKTISIFDALGRCIYFNENNTNVISISQIPKGVYTLLIKNKDNDFYHGIFIKE
jgi:hypothetical protein